MRRLFKRFRHSRRSLNHQADNGEAQPLLTPVIDGENKFNQYLAAVIANIIGISWGCSIGWSSPAIVKMTKDLPDSPLDYIPSSEQLSWIGSILPIGGLVGPILFAPLPGIVGRKLSLMLSSLFFVTSFFLLILTNDIISIYIARFLQGCGSGIIMVILPIYVAEISSAECRGVLSSFIQIGLVIGILYAYSIGPFVSYVTFQWLCLTFPLIFICTFVFMPDTPHYYLSRGNRNRAVMSLRYFRNKSAEEVFDELEEIQASLEDSMNHNTSFSEVFKGRPNLMAMTIVLGLISLQNFSGIDAVLFYSETILIKAGSSLNSSIATIVIGSVMLISSSVSSLFVDRSGRKGLLLVSAAGMAVSLTTMGIYFFLVSRDMTSGLGWIPTTALVIFILFYCVGFGPLPFTIMGEMFAPEIKSMASSFAVSACWICDFAVTKSFLPLESVVGNYGSFWIFAGFCVVAFIFTAKVVIETKGLTLNEIQDRLNGEKESTNSIHSTISIN